MGGYLLKRLSLDRTGAIKLYLFCQAIIIPLYFGFLIHCPTADIQVEFEKISLIAHSLVPFRTQLLSLNGHARWGVVEWIERPLLML